MTLGTNALVAGNRTVTVELQRRRPPQTRPPPTTDGHHRQGGSRRSPSRDPGNPKVGTRAIVTITVDRPGHACRPGQVRVAARQPDHGDRARSTRTGKATVTLAGLRRQGQPRRSRPSTRARARWPRPRRPRRPWSSPSDRHVCACTGGPLVRRRDRAGRRRSRLAGCEPATPVGRGRRLHGPRGEPVTARSPSRSRCSGDQGRAAGETRLQRRAASTGRCRTLPDRAPAPRRRDRVTAHRRPGGGRARRHHR